MAAATATTLYGCQRMAGYGQWTKMIVRTRTHCAHSKIYVNPFIKLIIG